MANILQLKRQILEVSKQISPEEELLDKLQTLTKAFDLGLIEKPIYNFLRTPLCPKCGESLKYKRYSLIPPYRGCFDYEHGFCQCGYEYAFDTFASR